MLQTFSNDNPSFPPTLLHTPTLTNARLLPVTVTLRLCVWSDRLECPHCVVQAAGVCVPHRSPTWWHRAANCQGWGRQTIKRGRLCLPGRDVTSFSVTPRKEERINENNKTNKQKRSSRSPGWKLMKFREMKFK